MADELKLARDYDIRFGHGLLKEDSAKWPRYVAVSTPSAWEVARPHLTNEPAGVVFNEWLDRTHLEERSDELPDDAELVVGMGGGRALDHAKVVAVRKGIPLIQAPSIVSTGAIIHNFCGNWTGRVMDGFLAEITADYVIVDYDVVLQAPENLNTAGIGDVLCGYAGLSEWRSVAANGDGPPFDDEATAGTMAHHAEIVEEFPKTLSPDGNLTPESVRCIMGAVQDRDDRMLRHPAAPNADHSFCFSVEFVNDRFWIHGETCALAAVLVAWHSGQSPETLVGWLDACKVRFRPLDMGMTKQQLLAGLEKLPEWLADKDTDSIMRRDPLVGVRFEQAWKWLTSV